MISPIRIVLCLTLMLAAGCASPPSSPVPTAPVAHTNEDRVAGTPPPPIDSLDAAYEYRIGPGDVIALFATAIPEINRKYVIGPDGKISVPGVGGVDLLKRTRAEAEAAINALLDRAYRDPAVTVIVEEYNNNRVYVLGEVRKPGEFNFAGRPTLLGALSRAEGLTKDADMRTCKVVRGKGTLIQVNLYELLEKGNRRLNLPLQPDDTVYVGANEENLFYVLGEVQRPGVFSLGERMDVVRAVAEAGGPTEDGVLSEVRVIRQSGDTAEVFTVDFQNILDGRAGAAALAIRAGDVVHVPEKALAEFNYIIRQISPTLNLLLIGDAVANIGD
jgi:polysaccharide biosynthesis/export protein